VQQLAGKAGGAEGVAVTASVTLAVSVLGQDVAYYSLRRLL
jgi:hypothetical protein